MIESLSVAEVWMKDENEASYNMDLATESARRSKIEWMKTVKYYPIEVQMLTSYLGSGPCRPRDCMTKPL